MAHIGRYAPRDIRRPGLGGLAATTVVCADPDLASTRILILTTFELDDYVARTIRAGASGFLGKDVGADSLLGGIRTAAVGDRLAELTAREREVMALAAEGATNGEIAGRLFLSPLTVRTHIQRAMLKQQA